MFKISESAKSILNEYKNLLKSTVDYESIYQTGTPHNIKIQGDSVELFSDGKRYYLFDEGRFFYCGNVDNNDLIQTAIDDSKKFGFVMLALMHLDDEEYFSSLLNLYEAEFYEELGCVLSNTTVKLDDDTYLPLCDHFEFYANTSESP